MPEVNAIPPGFNSVSSYLIVDDAEKAIEFYQKAFSAESSVCMRMPDGTVLHAEVIIGNSTVMLSGENPDWGAQSAKSLGGSPISLMIYCESADAMFEQAMAAGCKMVSPLEDTFWGDRMGKVEDPFGIQWSIATHQEDIPEDEMEQRMNDWLASMSGE